MSELIVLILNQHVDLTTVYLLLALPVIATLIAVLRQIVGIKSFGIYTPLVLTFAFWATGLKYGLAIFLVVLATGTISRYAFTRSRLLYMPRMAMMLTVISMGILALLSLGGYWGRSGLAATSILPILIMITLVEKFLSAQVAKGGRAAAILSVETLLISVIGFWLLEWPLFREGLLNYPWLIVLLIPFNFVLGKWGGIRLVEYFRFREVIKYVELD